MTTISQTTMAGATAPMGLGATPMVSDSCQVTVPDYSVLRQQNIKKINEYYNTLLSSYTQNYSDYSKQLTSNNVNDRTYASTTLKPKVSDYNSQIINLSQTMINNVNQDNDLITAQKNDLTSKMAKIDSIMANIKLLKDKANEMSIVTNARQDSLNSTKTGAEDMQFTTYIYIGISILLVLLIIGLIMYLVYSNYKTPTQINNNLYKNIAKNNK